MMKGWTNIKDAAKDLNISIRTCWRWVESGKIERREEDGRMVFTLSDTDMSGESESDVSGGTSGYKDVSQGKRKGRSTNPLKEVRGLIKPSDRVIEEWEEEEISGARLNKAKNLKELEKVAGSQEDPSVLDAEAQVKVAELDIRRYKAKQELQILQTQEMEEMRRKQWKERIEKIKLQILPLKFREYLGLKIALATLLELNNALDKTELSGLSDEELTNYAQIVRNSAFAKPGIGRDIQIAVLLYNRDVAIQYLKSQHQRYLKERIDWSLGVASKLFDEGTISDENYRLMCDVLSRKIREDFTFEKYWQEMVEETLQKNPQELSRFVGALYKFIKIVGGEDRAAEFEYNLKRGLTIMGKA
jgi:hypothetical protein